MLIFDLGPSKTGMKTGDLISRIASDTQIISKSLSMNISDGIRAIISGCVGLSMMLRFLEIIFVHEFDFPTINYHVMVLW